jgi:hypothetical protein
VDDLTLSLDLMRALALFLLLESRPDAPGNSSEPLDEVEEELRSYLYNRLSIEEMEHPDELYARLLKRKS